jgi:superfamily II RNA helicase
MLEILNSKDVKMPDNPAVTFPFECDTFQLHSFNSINEGKHILVSAPTSSGKTCCAEYAIHHMIRNNKRIIYTSPIKSLSNEKYKEFRDKNICSVGLLTGDNKINPDADLIIATAEILRNALFKNKENTENNDNKENNNENNILDNVGCVIMDEVHFINDMDRGKIWEETLILLDDSIQLVLLSATIDRVSEFAKWIQSIKKNTVSLITIDDPIVFLYDSSVPNQDSNLVTTFYYRNGSIYIVKLKTFEKTANIMSKPSLAFEMPFDQLLNIDSQRDIIIAKPILKNFLSKI